MEDKDKIKMGAAIVGLAVAIFLIYWFTIRTTPPGPEVNTPGASAEGGPAPAANRRVDPKLIPKQTK